MNLEFEYSYDDIPLIPVWVVSPETRIELAIDALVDSGSDISILDLSLAEDLGLELEGRPTRTFFSVGGHPFEAPTAELELLPFFNPDLAVRVSVAFLPGVIESVGNILGRDVLTFLDLGLSHAARSLQLGRTETLV